MDDEWDVRLVVLEYDGQLIDLDGALEMKLFDKTNKKWVGVQLNLDKSLHMNVYGLSVPIIPKEDLIAYKKLILRDVDISDINALKKKGCTT